jgi:hypothetical protein
VQPVPADLSEKAGAAGTGLTAWAVGDPGVSLEVVPPSAYRVADCAEQPEHQANHENDYAERPDDGYPSQEPDDEKKNAEDNHEASETALILMDVNCVDHCLARMLQRSRTDVAGLEQRAAANVPLSVLLLVERSRVSRRIGDLAVQCATRCGWRAT